MGTGTSEASVLGGADPEAVLAATSSLGNFPESANSECPENQEQQVGLVPAMEAFQAWGSGVEDQLCLCTITLLSLNLSGSLAQNCPHSILFC